MGLVDASSPFNFMNRFKKYYDKNKEKISARNLAKYHTTKSDESKEAKKAYDKLNNFKNRHKKWVADIKRKFGITEEQYNQMLLDQDGVCKICKQVEPSGKRLAVDHNKLTGQVRSLLCTLCNRYIVFVAEFHQEKYEIAKCYLNTSLEF